MSLLTGSSNEEEEEDAGGFGASLALMPIGAAGSVLLSLLGSLGSGLANASPTFKFDELQRRHYYGTPGQAVWMLVTILTKQGVSQVCNVCRVYRVCRVRVGILGNDERGQMLLIGYIAPERYVWHAQGRY